MKKTYNIWRSDLTGKYYRMDTDWMPEFEGWTLVATVEEEG